MRRFTTSFNAAAMPASWLAVFFAAVVLNGCSSVPLAPVQGSAPSTPQASTPDTPLLPPAGSGRGAYYKDDGPADVIPEGLANTPDAEPRIEPVNPRTSRPYVVFGKTYTPITHQRPVRQRGIASWYGKKFHGQKTASGELYDMFKMTAAHPTLPIPSYARVTHIASGRQIIVRINDRGPFHSGRVIDLSYTAALKLGYLGRGSGEVEVERLLPDDIAQINSSRLARQAGTAVAATAEPAAGVEVGEVATPAVTTVASTSTPTLTAAEPAATRQELPAATVASESPRLQGQPGSFYLQLGAFSQRANADYARQRLVGTGAAPWSALDVVESNGVFRLFGGPYASRAEADAAAAAVRAANSMNVIVVQR